MHQWYSNHTMCVRWSNNLSEQFGVTNGVKQGGILSPYLFNIYIYIYNIYIYIYRI